MVKEDQWVTKDLEAEIAEVDLPRRTRYDWANSHMTCQFSKYRWSSMVKTYAISIDTLSNKATEHVHTLKRCIAIDNVCHG